MLLQHGKHLSNVVRFSVQQIFGRNFGVCVPKQAMSFLSWLDLAVEAPHQCLNWILRCRFAIFFAAPLKLSAALFGFFFCFFFFLYAFYTFNGHQRAMTTKVEARKIVVGKVCFVFEKLEKRGNTH